MPATKHKNAIGAAFDRARGDIASLADWIELELEKSDAGEVTWASVGSLEHVRELMMETLAFFSDTEVREIQRNLDEVHGR